MDRPGAPHQEAQDPALRRRLLLPADEDEIRRFLVAAEDEGENVYILYATALYTGMREGELAGLRWDDVNFDTRLITVQRSFDGPTKAGDVRYVPLLDVLLPVLRQWRLRCPGPLVFPNERGGMHQESARVFQEIFHRVLDAGGVPEDGEERQATPLRRLPRSEAHLRGHWVMNGGDIFKLQRILGHKDITMTMRYSHLSPAAFAADFGRLGFEPPRAGGVVSVARARTSSLCNARPRTLQNRLADRLVEPRHGHARRGRQQRPAGREAPLRRRGEPNRA